MRLQLNFLQSLESIITTYVPQKKPLETYRVGLNAYTACSTQSLQQLM